VEDPCYEIHGISKKPFDRNVTEQYDEHDHQEEDCQVCGPADEVKKKTGRAKAERNVMKRLPRPP